MLELGQPCIEIRYHHTRVKIQAVLFSQPLLGCVWNFKGVFHFGFLKHWASVERHKDGSAWSQQDLCDVQ